MRQAILKSFVILFFVGFFSIAFLSCKEYKRNNSHIDVPLSSIRKGEALAIKYCQSCHLLPEPSLLDSKSWEKGVLPNMGPRLGIFHYGHQTYPSYRFDVNIDRNFYPSEPALSLEQWQNIIDYYTATSPDTLPKQDRREDIQTNLTLFDAQVPAIAYQNPATSFVKINSFDSLYPLIISDVVKQDIFLFNRKLEVKDSIHSSGPVVDMEFMKNKILVCDIGNLNPNNEKLGKGQYIHRNPAGGSELDSIALFDNLRRPVEFITADLNKDGMDDYVICEFGNLVGALSWMENLGNNKFERHVIRAYPGAIKAYINDYNHDGAPDLWVLFAQGEEGIFLFKNDGHGNFQSDEVLRFPSVYGSSYFELADFNNDGFPDIVYTCGDNADYSVVLKPYHGVYIFLNDKTNHFTQKYFYPIHGCYKAIARDYDGDGDLDIATISFFADYAHQPQEGFVYLENAGNPPTGQAGFEFHAKTLPGALSGRWLTMDAGDIDGDGRIDLVLGNFTLGPDVFKVRSDSVKPSPFIILKNTGK